MKRHAILAASLIATASLFALGAMAADQPTDTGTPAAAQSAPVQKKVKPHSHVQEKTGAPQDVTAAAAPDKPNPATDMTKHYHPRDMK